MNVPLSLAAAAAKTISERRAQDPLFLWQPTRPQGVFLASTVSEVWFIAANRCLPAGQRVLMADMSWKAIEDVRPGDLVVSVETPDRMIRGVGMAPVLGKPAVARVLRAGRSGRKPCVRLRFSNGHTLEASTDHPVLTATESRLVRRWKPAGELKAGRRQLASRPETVAALTPNEPLSPKFCRLIGYLLGDGSFVGDSIRFTNTNPEIVADFAACVPDGYAVTRMGESDYAVRVPGGVRGGNGLIRWLRRERLWGKACADKFIPAALRCASEECLRGLVAGLLATDGCVRPGRVTFYSTSRRLVEDLQLVLWRLGVYSLIRLRKPASGKHSPAWVLDITREEDIRKLPPVPGKPLRPVKRGRRSPDPTRVRIESVEEIGEQEVYDLTVDHPSHTFIAEGVVVHNSGKSDALAAAIASFARFGNPDPRPAIGPSGVVLYDRAVSIWAISLTFPLGRDVLQAKIFDNGFVPAGQPHKPFIPPWEIADGGWTSTNQVLKLKNGSLVGFKSCDQKRDIFQGVGRDMVAFDEAPPWSIYDEATMRVEAGRRLLIRGAATLLPPEGMIGGVSWLYPKKIQVFQSKGAPAGLLIVGASIYDNPHILPEELARLEAKYPEGSVDRRIRLDGEWLPGMAGALAYPAFHRAVHVNPALGRHVREHRLPLMWNLDFNVEPMGTTVFQRVGRVYRGLDEITLESANDVAIAEEFCRRFPDHGAALWIHGDATGKRRNVQTNKTDYMLILEVLRRLPYPVEMRVPEDNPGVIDRINAVNNLLRGVGGEVRLELAPTMVETIADFEEVLRDKSGGIKKTTNRMDPYCRRTAWTDGIGYMAAYNEPVGSSVGGSGRRLVSVKSPGYSFSGPGGARK